MSNKYQILAYYHFVQIEDPQTEVTVHKQFFQDKDIVSRIYISHYGINGQMSASCRDAKAYIKWIQERPLFQNIQFKVHSYHEHVFPRQTVKFRQNLVGHDQPIDLSKRGEYVSPKKWKQMMQERGKYLLLDIR